MLQEVHRKKLPHPVVRKATQLGLICLSSWYQPLGEAVPLRASPANLRNL